VKDEIAHHCEERSNLRRNGMRMTQIKWIGADFFLFFALLLFVKFFFCENQRHLREKILLADNAEVRRFLFVKHRAKQQQRFSIPSLLLCPVVYYFKYYFKNNCISTRLFSARPSTVALLATGLVSPKPRVSKR